MLFALTKGQLLLLGLTKASTFLLLIASLSAWSESAVRFDQHRLSDRPAAVLVDCRVDLGHQADCLAEGDDDLLVVLHVFVGEFPALAVFQPFLADLVAADVKLPDRLGHAAEVLRLVDPDASVLFPRTATCSTTLSPLTGQSVRKSFELGRFQQVEGDQLGPAAASARKSATLPVSGRRGKSILRNSAYRVRYVGE